MKEYVNNFYGIVIIQENDMDTVELYNGDTIEHTYTDIADENIANATIIPWVVQEGYLQEEKNSETDPVDPSDPLFERDFIKV